MRKDVPKPTACREGLNHCEGRAEAHRLPGRGYTTVKKDVPKPTACSTAQPSKSWLRRSGRGVST